MIIPDAVAEMRAVADVICVDCQQDMENVKKTVKERTNSKIVKKNPLSANELLDRYNEEKTNEKFNQMVQENWGDFRQGK